MLNAIASVTVLGQIISVISVAPSTIATRVTNKVRVSVRVGKDERLNAKSAQLFQSDEQGVAIEGALCDLNDNGDSRDGDDRAGDFVFSCSLELRPRRVATMYVVAKARYGSRTVSSRPFAVRIVSLSSQRTSEDLAEKEQIMSKARGAWLKNKKRFGLADHAIAVTVREIEQFDGVKEVRRNTSNDIIILFKTGGMDQLSTFEP